MQKLRLIPGVFVIFLTIFISSSDSRVIRKIRGYDYHGYGHGGYGYGHGYDHDDDSHEYDHDHEHDDDSKEEKRAVATSPPPTQNISPGQGQGQPQNESCTCTVVAFVPQCGSDGKTYVDECQFKCAQRKNPSLKLAKAGQCTSTPTQSG